MTPIFRIRDWDKHFENAKSRTIDHCSYVCIPNKQHGMGFTRLMAEPDGTAIFGIWILIVEALSRQARPRDGWLTEDGTENGSPWTSEDLALMWRRPVEEIERAINFLSSSKIAWIEGQGKAVSIRDVPREDTTVAAKYPPNEHILEQNRTERTEDGLRRNGKTVSRSPRQPNSCDEEYLEKLQRNVAYQNLDVKYVYGKMVAWCEGHHKQPTRRRLVNWLNREDVPFTAAISKNGKVVVKAETDEQRQLRENCTRCWGTGSEIVEGKGARICDHSRHADDVDREREQGSEGTPQDRTSRVS